MRFLVILSLLVAANVAHARGCKTEVVFDGPVTVRSKEAVWLPCSNSSDIRISKLTGERFATNSVYLTVETNDHRSFEVVAEARQVKKIAPGSKIKGKIQGICSPFIRPITCKNGAPISIDYVDNIRGAADSIHKYEISDLQLK